MYYCCQHYLTVLGLLTSMSGLAAYTIRKPKINVHPIHPVHWRVNMKPTMTTPVTLLQPIMSVRAAGQCVYYCDSFENSEIFCEFADKHLEPIKMYCQRSYCKAHDIEHLYEQREANGSITLQPHVNRFEVTAVGQLAIMRDVCLHNNGLPVTRLCTLVDGLAAWATLPRVTCRSAQGLSNKLLQLHNDIANLKWQPNATQDWRDLATQLSSLWRQPRQQVLPVDVVATQQLFASLSRAQQKDVRISADMLSISASIMSTNASVLRRSAELNATNELLDQFESYMDAVTQQVTQCGQQLLGGSTPPAAVQTLDYSELGVHALLTAEISVFFVNPRCANITGLAVYDSAGAERLASRHGFWYRLLPANADVSALRQEAGLEAATLLPTSLWQAVQRAGAGHLVLKVYTNAALFVETAQQLQQRPYSKVLSISLPHYTAGLPDSVPFLLRNEHFGKSPLGSGCAYWNYSTWVQHSVSTSSSNSSADAPQPAVMLCQATHLTQFAFLVGGSYVQQPLQDNVLDEPLSLRHERILDKISAVGCALSLFGLLGIWLTALLFASWRKLASTKLLLHLCVALTLQMLLFVFLNTDEWSERLALAQHYTQCMQLGAALQYAVLVVFSWMLILAYIQYQRYVVVLGAHRPQNFVLKAALVAWTLPLLPTLLLVLLDPSSYMPTQRQLATHTALCYPSGHGLTYGVALPICLVTAANVLMVCRIFNSVYRMQHPNRSLIVQQLQLSVLLFFLLGLTWIFGILSFMRLGITFSYIFCLTATLQGFVIFVYFVLLDSEARRCWIALLKGQKAKQRPKQSVTNSTFVQVNQKSNE